MIINSHDSNLNFLQFFFPSAAAASRYKRLLRVKHASIKLWRKNPNVLCRFFLSFSPLKSWMCRVLINKIIISACKRCLLTLAAVNRLLVCTCSAAHCLSRLIFFFNTEPESKIEPDSFFCFSQISTQIKAKTFCRRNVCSQNERAKISHCYFMFIVYKFSHSLLPILPPHRSESRCSHRGPPQSDHDGDGLHLYCHVPQQRRAILSQAGLLLFHPVRCAHTLHIPVHS